VINRLEASGWVQQNDDGDVELWHDRLLGWAVAKASVHRLCHNRLTHEQLEAFLNSVEKREDLTLRRLVYLPMDLLWLMLDPQSPLMLHQAAQRVLNALDHESGYGIEAERLYQEVLPTLGSRIAPLLITHLKEMNPQEPHPLPKLVASALSVVSDGEPDEVKRHIGTCLYDTSSSLQEVGLRLLAKVPDSDATERVWELHRPLARNPSDDFRRHELTSRAFSATVGVAPDRAARLFRQPDCDGSDLATVLYALAGSNGEKPAEVWARNKREWIEWVPPEKSRCLVNCILRFRDRDELDLLERLVSSEEEIVGPWALVILALFDPVRAVGLLYVPPANRLFGLQQRLAQIFLAFAPDKMLAEVRRLASQHPDVAPVYLQMLVLGGDRLGPEAVDALVEWADRSLRQYLSDPEHQDKHQLYQPLTALASFHGSIGLQQFENYAGSPFEGRLADAALRWADNTSGYVDHVMENTLTVLLKIGGEGLTRVNNAQLKAQSWQICVKGCEWAPIRPNNETRRLLGDLARSESLEAGGNRPFPIVQQKAADALAAVGEDAALIRAILRWGTQISPYVTQLRQGQNEMSDAAIKPAADLLDTPHDEWYSNAILALGQSGRTDYRRRIQNIFRDSRPDSSVALCAVLALAHLGRCGEELLPYAISQYRSGYYKFPTLQLLQLRLPDEAEFLVPQLLPESPPYDEMDQRLIVYMATDLSRRPFVEQQLSDVWKNRATIGTSFLFDRPHVLDPTQPDEQEELWRRATSVDCGIHVGGEQAGAVERLAKTEPEAASDVAEQAIRRQAGDWAKLPEVLLKSEVPHAVSRLVDIAANGASMHVCHEIAVALRR